MHVMSYIQYSIQYSMPATTLSQQTAAFYIIIFLAAGVGGVGLMTLPTLRKPEQNYYYNYFILGNCVCTTVLCT
jgi:hypothetical protein